MTRKDVQPIFGNGGLQRLGGNGLERQARRETDALEAQAEVELTRDNARAFLTAAAMGNTSNLVAQAKQHLQNDPEAAPYLEALIRAYANGATQRLQRWN